MRRARRSPSYMEKVRKGAKRIDIKSELNPEQLIGIGAVCVAWNYIDAAIDLAMCLALRIHPRLWIDLGSRINGFDGKVEIIRRAARLVFQMPEDSYLIFATSIAAIEEHKRYRDGVIHARIINPESPTADSAQRRGKIDEVLVTPDALNALYDRLNILQQESDVIALIFHLLYVSDNPKSDNDKKLVEEWLPACIPQLQEHQKRRLSLPPLPEFPDEPPSVPESEAPQWPLG